LPDVSVIQKFDGHLAYCVCTNCGRGINELSFVSSESAIHTVVYHWNKSIIQHLFAND
jgi:hypothetical protein